MTWVSVALKSDSDHSSKPVIRRVHYEGPPALAVGETEVLGRRAGPETNGTTRIAVTGLPEMVIDCGYGPRDTAIKNGLSGRLGDKGLRIVRPQFSLTPRRAPSPSSSMTGGAGPSSALASGAVSSAAEAPAVMRSFEVGTP